jgi:hypothetical protein
VPYESSVEQTYAALLAQVLTSGDYLWPWEYTSQEGMPRPSASAGLDAAKDSDLFWDVGTHSILDTDKVTDGDEDEFGAIRAPTALERHDLFGSERPSAADFDRVHRRGDVDFPLEGVLGDRWTGRSVVLYRDGVPDEVYFRAIPATDPARARPARRESSRCARRFTRWPDPAPGNRARAWRRQAAAMPVIRARSDSVSAAWTSARRSPSGRLRKVACNAR